MADDPSATTSPDAAHRAQVLLLTGPSGSGKTRLARRLGQTHGWPLVPLDDYYHPFDAPDLPRRPDGLVDWDHVGTWDVDAAEAGLHALVGTGATEVPTYDISTSSVVGRRTVERGDAPIVVAEGIFAAHLAPRLEEVGLLAAAWCITAGPWTTFARRLARDLAERRKPPAVLWERGNRLRRTEPQFVAQQRTLGARVMSPRDGEHTAAVRWGAGRGV
ncbi:uridine kinase family protein [Kytococcus sp. Marseille-QA3725]